MNNSRTRPVALDGHSIEADHSISADAKVKVEVVILDILRRIGAATDDQIVTLYQTRAEAYADVPRVTEQRIRTARAAMVRRGVLGAHPQAGFSRHGNTATRWRPVASGT